MIEAITLALAFIGGFWFFVFALCFLVIGIVAAESDSGLGAIITILGLALGAQFLFGIPVWGSIVDNPLLLVAGLFSYIILGFGYAIFFKYPNFLVSRADDIKRRWNDFRRNRQGKEFDYDSYRKSTYYEQFTPAKNSDRIFTWVTLWPWGVFWDLCHRPIRWVYNTVYKIAVHALNNIGTRVSNRILDDQSKDGK